VESDEGEHKTLEILDQVVETPAKNTKQISVSEFLCKNYRTSQFIVY
jgi:hypothetical protein